MKRLAAFFWIARPLILPAGILAYALGTAMGYWRTGAVAWGAAAAGLAVTLVANVAATYANEYADVDTDTLARRTRFSGGSGMLPAGRVPAAWVLRAAVALAILALVLTVALIASGVLPAQAGWILGAGLIMGWFYSMPPLQLERRGLGELDNAAIGGILMPLMGSTAQVGRPTAEAALALVPIFMLVLVHLLGVHWPDREADEAVGKRTLVVIVGGWTRPIHHALLGVAYLVVLVLTPRTLPVPVAVGLFAALPVALWPVLTFERRPLSSVPSGLAMAAALLGATIGWIVAAP
jgi:1,4-dihydroxy-2-naphthoate octaprenyltransferase